MRRWSSRCPKPLNDYRRRFGLFSPRFARVAAEGEVKFALCCTAAIALAGCVKDTYDVNAVPAARSAYQLSEDTCLAGLRTMQFRTTADYVECHLAAVHQFTVAIKLSKPDLFDNFAARERLLASQADAGAIMPPELVQSLQQIEADFYGSVQQDQGIANERHARIQQAAQGIATGLQQAGAQIQQNAAREQMIYCTATGPTTASYHSQ